MKNCQNNNNYPSWLLWIVINLLGLFSLSTFIAIKSASADVVIKEVSKAEKLQPHQKSRPKFITALIESKKQKNITSKTDLPANLGNISTEAKQLFPIQSQTISQEIDLSQNTSDNSQNIDLLRQDLLIKPLFPITPVTKRTYQPGLSFGAPSAFGAAWGDLFIGAAGATAGKARNGNPDGSMSAGFGLGNAYNLIGLEFTFNNGSIKNFGYNGTFDFKAHRVVYVKPNHQIAIAGGWNAFAQYGNEGIRPSSAYGVITSYSFLQPNNPKNPMALSLSVGAGGGDFRQGDASTGIFGSVGLQVHPQVGMGIGWSGVGLNAGISFVPIPTIPFTINAQGADLTDNSPGGTVFVLSIGYGFNFLPR